MIQVKKLFFSPCRSSIISLWNYSPDKMLPYIQRFPESIGQRSGEDVDRILFNPITNNIVFMDQGISQIIRASAMADDPFQFSAPNQNFANSREQREISELCRFHAII